MALLVSVAACGSEAMPTAGRDAVSSSGAAAATEVRQRATASATATARPATATPVPSATAVATATLLPPTERPATATPAPTESSAEDPGPARVAIAEGHPAAALALLPGDSPTYAYIDLGTVSERPDLREHVEFQLSHFVGGSELPFAEELLLTVGARALALSSPGSRAGWACVLWGDFGMVGQALMAAAQSGAGLSVDLAESHRDVPIYGLTRKRDSGDETEIYLAVPTGEFLVASPGLEPVREAIDRHIDGGDLPEGLATMVSDWGLGDYLFVASLTDLEGFVEGPTGEAIFFAYHVTLAEAPASVLRGMWQFEDEEHAALAAGWLQAQPEAHWKNIGWGGSVSIDQWRRRGSTVYGEAIVADEDLPSLVQGN